MASKSDFSADFSIGKAPFAAAFDPLAANRDATALQKEWQEERQRGSPQSNSPKVENDPNSPLMERLFTIEAADKFALQKIDGFIKSDPEQRLPLLEREAAKGKNELLSPEHLEGLQTLESVFKDDRTTLQRIVDIEAGEGLNLKQLARFIELDPEKLKPFIAGRIKAGETAKEIGEYVPDGEPFGRLAYQFCDDIPALNRIRQMKENNQLDLKHLEEFVAIDPTNGRGVDSSYVTEESRKSLVSRELLRGASGEQLNSYYRLRGLEQLEKQFPPGTKTMNRLLDMEAESGLSLWNLGRYIGDLPDSRAKIIASEIENGASVKQIQDQIKLAAFPTDVALELAKQAGRGSFKTGELIGSLRDLQSGPYMQKLVREHIEEGKTLTAEEIGSFANRSREMFAQGELIENVRPDWQPRSTLLLPTAAQATVADMAASIKQAANDIMASVPPDQTMVLLGRDMGPLLPILRANGRDARYFLWSRSQIGDSSTAQQWLKEVPPDAVVIDAGLAGSIFDDILKTDTTIQPVLMESAGRYPEFPTGTMKEAATFVEIFPKLTGRSRAYNENGTALAPESNRDAQDFHNPNHRLEAIQYNSQLLRDLGLSDWYVWRYGTFTGLSPAERIGVGDAIGVQQEYSQVQQLRHQIDNEREIS